MRWVIVAGWLFFGAVITGAQEPAPAVRYTEGGFAPEGANFKVTFGFSDMPPASKASKEAGRMLGVPGVAMSVMEWASASGAVARLDIGCVKRPMGLSDITLAVARLRVSNPTDHPFQTSLVVAIAPQGGIQALAFERHAFLIEGRVALVADTPSRGAILAESPFAPRPLTPQDQAHVESVKGECRGEMLFDLAVAPGQTQTLGFICPVHLTAGSEPVLDAYRALSVEELFTEALKQTAGRGSGAP